MNIIIGLTFICAIANPGSAIDCFRCNSTNNRECLEKFLQPSTLRAESCSDVFEARYCIKTTGIYNGEVGDQRFCSARDLGNYCEYMRREGDDKEFRSCVYTCDTNACNSASTMSIRFVTVLALLILLQKTLCLQ